MAHYVRYHCEACNQVFRYFHHPDDEPPPDHCALCGAEVAREHPLEPVFVPLAPRIRENPYARSIDQVYRAQEEASNERAADAAEALADVFAAQRAAPDHQPGPEDAMVAHAQALEIAGLKSGLKITDMQDPSSLREGDVAAVTATPPALRTGGGTAGFQNLGGAVPNYAPDIPMTGDDTRAKMSTEHAQRAQVMTQRGQLRPTYIDRG